MRNTWSWQGLGAAVAWLGGVVLTPSGLGQKGREVGGSSTDPSTDTKRDRSLLSTPSLTPQICGPKL